MVSQYVTGSDDGFTSIPDTVIYGLSGGMPVGIQAGGSVTIDRFGNIYLTGEVGGGMSWSVPAPNAIVGFGFVNSPYPRRIPAPRAEVEDTLKGFCFISTAFIVAGGSISVCLPSGGTYLTIFATGAIGFSTNVSLTRQVGHLESYAWDWWIQDILVDGVTYPKIWSFVNH